VLGRPDAPGEALGVPIRVVEGDPDNFKVTHAGDLAAAERWLRERGDAA
jgi:2-C-methyl-D-erythritol 4-phosphate cytidylyltransferase